MSDDASDFQAALRMRLARFSYLAALQLQDVGEPAAIVQSLPERMFPRSPRELVGTEQRRALSALLTDARRAGSLEPVLLSGPSGCGKSSLAQLVAAGCGLSLERIAPHALAPIGHAEDRPDPEVPKALLLEAIDRFPKAQLDELRATLDREPLPLIATTSENPWVSVPSALLCRMRVIELAALTELDLLGLLDRTLGDRARGLGALGVQAPSESLIQIARASGGNARIALALLERAARLTAERGDDRLSPERVTHALAQGVVGEAVAAEDRSALERAFADALDQSDPDAALYWMMRMLRAGEAPSFVVRRMMLFASEHIGNADPSALDLSVTTDQVLQRLGMPEALRSMGQCCVYLASAPKSDASYVALQQAERDVREHGALAPPSDRSSLLPARLRDRQYYQPSNRGLEAQLRQQLSARRR